MENIGEKTKDAESDDHNKTIEKRVLEMKENGIKESSKNFNEELSKLGNGLEKIKKDLNRFNDSTEKDYLDILCEEIKESYKKITEFNNFQIEPYKKLLVESLLSDIKKSDYERRTNESNKEEIMLAGNVLKDKMKIIEKIDKIKNAIDDYKMGAKFIKAKNNSEVYINSEINDLDVIRGEITKLSDALEKYAKLLKREIMTIEKREQL